MRMQSLFRRRPSASLVISVIALFVAMGGVGYAAVQIPANSVGNSQLKNNAVSNSKIKDNSVNYKKIASHTIGLQRVDNTKIQTRVSGTCAGNSAINTVAQGGKVTCHSTLPPEFGAASDSAAVSGTRPRCVEAPPGGNYLITQTCTPPSPALSLPPDSRCPFTCTLQVASGSSQTQDGQRQDGPQGAEPSGWRCR